MSKIILRCLKYKDPNFRPKMTDLEQYAIDLKLRILLWSGADELALQSFPLDKVQLLNVPQVKRLVQQALYGFSIEDMTIDRNIISLTIRPNDELPQIYNIQDTNDLQQHLIDNFGQRKYDTWMSSDMSYPVLTENDELDFELCN